MTRNQSEKGEVKHYFTCPTVQHLLQTAKQEIAHNQSEVGNAAARNSPESVKDKSRSFSNQVFAQNPRLWEPLKTPAWGRE
jgi:hypothetical protein